MACICMILSGASEVYDSATHPPAPPITERFFNTAGPSILADHYMLDPLARIHYQDIEQLIVQKRYFILHAPQEAALAGARTPRA